MKNTHLTQEKSIKRKLNEIKIAKQLEKEYSKDDILTSYLNVSYFGGGLYGVKSAAKGIFNKNLSSLTLSECAVLAGILKIRQNIPLSQASKTRRKGETSCFLL